MLCIEDCGVDCLLRDVEERYWAVLVAPARRLLAPPILLGEVPAPVAALVYTLLP